METVRTSTMSIDLQHMDDSSNNNLSFGHSTQLTRYNLSPNDSYTLFGLMYFILSTLLIFLSWSGKDLMSTDITIFSKCSEKCLTCLKFA